MSRPAHHGPDGRFTNPWEVARGDGELRGKIGRVAWEWLTGSHPPDPGPDDLPRAEPDLAAPSRGEARATWIGHATTLVRLPGLTVLTDPVWSDRCSPVPFWGPKRFVPPEPALEELPEVDAVLLSHDHFDHLDHDTVVALHRRFGDGLVWLTPLGYRDWFARRGVERVVELDWWEEAELPGGYRAACLPARHWTRRTPLSTNRRLWASWALVPGGEVGEAEPAARPRVYFGGDSGYCPAFREIGERYGPFDLSLLPVGAYEPRWFMKASHMNPEEAVRAYRELGGRGHLLPIHWGTWRLTFEDPLEPPERTWRAWAEAGLDPARLRLPGHGGTVSVNGRGPGG